MRSSSRQEREKVGALLLQISVVNSTTRPPKYDKQALNIHQKHAKSVFNQWILKY